MLTSAMTTLLAGLFHQVEQRDGIVEIDSRAETAALVGRQFGNARRRRARREGGADGVDDEVVEGTPARRRGGLGPAEQCVVETDGGAHAYKCHKCDIKMSSTARR